tara:strand:+ start:1546 stop:2100 length:555 start_codon:yes stop_codon:yes gene_type:complete
MKIEFLIFALTIFLIANTYHDGKYVKILKSWKKYYQMVGIAFIGISTYVYIKKFPLETHTLISNANNIIKFMPIDKEASELLSPLLNVPQNLNGIHKKPISNYSQENRILNSGKNTTKRSVSETKKKYVAAEQGWKCGDCKRQLPAWFEIDHNIRLDQGGSNHVDNLVALCRDCHGKKTAVENL